MATAIVDYGLGNLGSIANMLKVIGEKYISQMMFRKSVTLIDLFCPE